MEKNGFPEWFAYLEKKKVKVKTTMDVRKLKDIVLNKKILRDVREFFRIIFRNRFIPMEFSNNYKKEEWVKILLSELGLSWAHKLPNLLHYFPFFFQVHIPVRLMENKKMRNAELNAARWLEVYEKYNQQNQIEFLQDPLWCWMLNYVFENYRDNYIKYVRSKLYKRVESIVDNMLIIARGVLFKILLLLEIKVLNIFWVNKIHFYFPYIHPTEKN